MAKKNQGKTIKEVVVTPNLSIEGKTVSVFKNAADHWELWIDGVKQEKIVSVNVFIGVEGGAILTIERPLE